MTRTATIRDAIMNASGTDELAAIAAGLTAEESREADELVTRRYGGSYSAALGVRDPELARQVDALFAH